MMSTFLYISLAILLKGLYALEVATKLPEEVTKILTGRHFIEGRRIINGDEAMENMPFMVYLKLPNSSKKKQNYKTWLCGGAIVHEEYIITSAACIEDVDHFYIVSGTYKFSVEDDRFTNNCIKNGAKKAIWKCVPKNYVFDGHENDNIRWMNNDIAVVKIEDGFDFTRRVRGCDYIPRPIGYNNQSIALENPGNLATIAGWGSTLGYGDWINRRSGGDMSNYRRDGDTRNLLGATVEIITKTKCKRRWGQRYHHIIDNYMICTKDLGQTMSEICNEKYVDCKDINYSDEDHDEHRRVSHIVKSDKVPTNLMMHSAYHNESIGNQTRRAHEDGGGFCENDHGGPIIHGTGSTALVIGIISACLVKEKNNKCYGPFLYTSIYKNRQFISCAIFKEAEVKCRRQFRSGFTHEEKVISWMDHPDGPALNEIKRSVAKPVINVPRSPSISALKVPAAVEYRKPIENILRSGPLPFPTESPVNFTAVNQTAIPNIIKPVPRTS